jgi:hypothetical protein
MRKLLERRTKLAADRRIVSATIDVRDISLEEVHHGQGLSSRNCAESRDNDNDRAHLFWRRDNGQGFSPAFRFRARPEKQAGAGFMASSASRHSAAPNDGSSTPTRGVWG